jgi:hypothetical protein
MVDKRSLNIKMTEEEETRHPNNINLRAL